MGSGKVTGQVPGQCSGTGFREGPGQVPGQCCGRVPGKFRAGLQGSRAMFQRGSGWVPGSGQGSRRGGSRTY